MVTLARQAETIFFLKYFPARIFFLLEGLSNPGNGEEANFLVHCLSPRTTRSKNRLFWKLPLLNLRRRTRKTSLLFVLASLYHKDLCVAIYLPNMKSVFRRKRQVVGTQKFKKYVKTSGPTIFTDSKATHKNDLKTRKYNFKNWKSRYETAQVNTALLAIFDLALQVAISTLERL